MAKNRGAWGSTDWIAHGYVSSIGYFSLDALQGDRAARIGARDMSTCHGSGYIICHCYGDAQPAGVEAYGCTRCGGNAPCSGCENCELEYEPEEECQ